MTTHKGATEWIGAMACDHSLSSSAVRVGAYLGAVRATWSTGEGVYPAMATIQADTGLGRTTVWKALQALVDRRWLVVVARPVGKPTRYRLNLERDDGVPVRPGERVTEETGGTKPTGAPLGCVTESHQGAPVERPVERPVGGPVGSCGKLWKAIGTRPAYRTGGRSPEHTPPVHQGEPKRSTKQIKSNLEDVAGEERDGGVSLPREHAHTRGGPPPASDRHHSTQGERDEDEQAEHTTTTTGPVDMEGRALERLALVRSLVTDLDALDRDAIIRARPCLADLAPLVPEFYSLYAQGHMLWAINLALVRWGPTIMEPVVWPNIQPDLALLGDDDAIHFAVHEIMYQISQGRDLTDDADRAYVWTSLRSARAREKWRKTIMDDRRAVADHAHLYPSCLQGDGVDIMRHAMTVGMLLRWRVDIGLPDDRPGYKQHTA